MRPSDIIGMIRAMNTQRIVSLPLAVFVLCGAVFMHGSAGPHRDVIVAGNLHVADHVHTETREPAYPFYFPDPGSLSAITTGADGIFYQRSSPTELDGC